MKEVDILEVVEREMLALWANDTDIPHLLEVDEDFIRVICEGIYLEKSFWKRHMVVGED